MTEGKQVKVREAKGRPMLTWVGKRPLRRVTAFPAQKVETFNPTGEPQGNENLLLHGNNKDVLAWLLANGYRGKVDLIYIDPPFHTGADYVRQVKLRGVAGASEMDGEHHTLGEQIQYTDIWANDNYLQFMYERLALLSELLAERGSIYVHMDWRRAHYLKLVMDEVFGGTQFRNEIIWHYFMGGKSPNLFGKKHDTILWYSKSDKWEFRRLQYKRRLDYVPGLPSKSSSGKEIEQSTGKDEVGWYSIVSMDDVWDISGVFNMSSEYLAFPTQKPEALMERIIKACSNAGDLVLDAFVGCGTTAAVGQKLGRRWIACDINKGAIQTTSKRLQTTIVEQTQNGEDHAELEGDEDETAPPASLSFSVYRVNNYDLQMQHNEAINLVSEHIGVTRTRTDHFFDGTRGKNLVKIIAFGQPLTPLDLEQIRNELEARPEEERDVTVVALGADPKVAEWLDEYNQKRPVKATGGKEKEGGQETELMRPVNKIELIELRTDEKYGEFMVHEPARARLKIGRADGKIGVEIEDFISPTILKRLRNEEGVLQVQIEDWRSMVDCVMIDTAYDGEVFNVCLSDVPQRKNDLVDGVYEMEGPQEATTVAVKIIDMLGEEVLETEEIEAGKGS